MIGPSIPKSKEANGSIIRQALELIKIPVYLNPKLYIDDRVHYLLNYHFLTDYSKAEGSCNARKKA